MTKFAIIAFALIAIAFAGASARATKYVMFDGKKVSEEPAPKCLTCEGGWCAFGVGITISCKDKAIGCYVTGTRTSVSRGCLDGKRHLKSLLKTNGKVSVCSGDGCYSFSNTI